MITRKYTKKPFVLKAEATSLFAIVSIMLIVKRFKVVTITKFQIYLWALQNKDNIRQILNWKKDGKITNVPWMYEDITPLIIQCVLNRLLKTNTNKSGKVSLEFDINADIFLESIKDLELSKKVSEEINKIGNITDKQLKNLELDF